jgi:phosphomannomutase
VPRLSEFYGIVIAMFFDDHDPPHYYAVYGGGRATYTIDPVRRLAGSLPRRAEALVVEWAVRHQEELGENWQRARRHSSLHGIAPLE